MRLEAIVLDQYKSIRTPIRLEFRNNLVLLLGKNGSGKSNILQALHTIFSHRFDLSFQKTAFNFRLELSLSREEVRQIYGAVDYDDAHRKLLLKNDATITDHVLIESPTFTAHILDQQQLMQQQAEHVRLSIDQFKADLQKVVPSSNGTTTEGIPLLRHHASLQALLAHCDQLLDAVEAMRQEKIISGHYVVAPSLPRVALPAEGLHFVGLELQPLALSSLEQPYVVVDWEGLQSKVTEVNQALASRIEAIDQGLQALAATYQKLNYLLRSVDDVLVDRLDFNQEMRTLLNRNCYYVASDGLTLFPKGGVPTYLDPSSAIFDALATSGYEKTKAPVFLEAMRHGVQGLSEEQRTLIAHEFETLMNEEKPEFELDMIRGYRVTLDDQQQLQILVEETDGTLVPFHATSSGRRWFYTYYFLRQRVRPHDYLILDEPGVFLHPMAQRELLDDIQALAARGVHVFYSTHSPYLITHQVDSINIVELREQGTTISPMTFDPQGFDEMCERIGYMASQDFLLNFQWRHVLVEGDFDRVYLEAMSRYFKISRQIHFIPGAGDNLKNLIPVFEQLGLNFIVIVDGDKAEKDWVKRFQKEGKRLYLLPVDYIEHMLEGDDKVYHTRRLRSDDKKEIARKFQQAAAAKKLDPKTVENFRKLFQTIGLLRK